MLYLVRFPDRRGRDRGDTSASVNTDSPSQYAVKKDEQRSRQDRAQRQDADLFDFDCQNRG